jgi:hypothetical protein
LVVWRVLAARLAATVALDDGELGEIAVADNAAELGPGLEHAGGQTHVTLCRRLTLRGMRRTVAIIDSHGLVEASVR